jgi:hypothetical protein
LVLATAVLAEISVTASTEIIFMNARAAYWAGTVVRSQKFLILIGVEAVLTALNKTMQISEVFNSFIVDFKTPVFPVGQEADEKHVIKPPRRSCDLRNKRKPLPTTRGLPPTSTNTTINLVPRPISVSTRNTAFIPSTSVMFCNSRG